ncbi:probable RNA-dependent RNA polymerase 1 [Olea europaea subsp. europaea]|uniref:RNA-dependent RNA polymerase n=1 Tax=Olea europaea subsp. europaea TaxID=158383 RepID=A0A8S0TGL9_OLEEU|nr:probable RNA-dependent RNA polymerase 1 [Olea europaea subsp. europaea]
MFRVKVLLAKDPNYKKWFKFDHVWPMLKDAKKFGDDVNTAKAIYHRQGRVNIASSQLDSSSEDHTSTHSTSPRLSSFSLNINEDNVDDTSTQRPTELQNLASKIAASYHKKHEILNLRGLPKPSVPLKTFCPTRLQDLMFGMSFAFYLQFTVEASANKLRLKAVEIGDWTGAGKDGVFPATSFFGGTASVRWISAVGSEIFGVFLKDGAAEYALEKLYNLKECCYDPVSWLMEQYEKYCKMERTPKSPAISLDDGLVYVRRVQVTPSKVYFSGPEVNVSNRVLRHYRKDIDNFLRVSFVDEEWDKMYSTDLSPKVASGNENIRTEIYIRILSTLRNGIVIGDKKFDFLAFSSSQLRDNSVWMFASTATDNADDIRRWMGDFRSIKNVAKYAARLGQSFGSSTETLNVDKDEIEFICDIEAIRGGIFSDGIGKISAEFARKVAIKCGLKNSFPSAFQIRYGGYKGVVAVDPSSRRKLSLRPSMLKYQSDNTKLDVLAWSKYQPCFLNRQIISLLSTLGVADHVFEKKQREAVDQLDTILVDPLRAEEALDLMSPGENTNILKEMLRCGYLSDSEPFLSMMLQTFRASKLLDLRVKSRIFVPQARQMMGCLDETGNLEYGQMFVQFSCAGRRRFHEDFLRFIGNMSDDYNYIVKGMVAVAKNPCLHPGDVRKLVAVDVPALHHMVDCVVFPRKGQRPHPNECSGSDLDGDIYFVCWDLELIPPKQSSPMDYTPAPSTQQDHDVTIEEVGEYFTNYIVNDSLGIIANAHTVFADAEPSKALSEPCIELAKLFSIAVDFPKTGVPAVIPPHLRVKEYPDFMEKPDKTTYESKHVIGKLFRDVKNIASHTAPIQSSTREVAMESYDHDMEVDGFEEYIEEAFHYKTEYDYKLGNLMDYYGIKTEAEILSGGIMKTSKSFDRRRDADAIGAAVRSLRSEARKMFKKGSESNDMDAKASAWYHVTYHHEYWGRYNEGLNRDHYISFPWCVYDKLVQIKKEKSSRRRSLQMSSLERKFKLGMGLT